MRVKLNKKQLKFIGALRYHQENLYSIDLNTGIVYCAHFKSSMNATHAYKLNELATQIKIELFLK